MKVLQKVATVVAIAASIALAATTLGASLPISAALLTTIATVAAATVALSSFFVKPPGLGGGSSTDWKADPTAGVPYAIGRTASGGNIVHHASFGTDNKFIFFTTVHSLGPIESYETLIVDKVATSFTANNAVGYYNNRMWLDTQLGDVPEAAALAPTNGVTWPGWDSTSKLSGLAADLWELKYDVKGDQNYINGIPKRLTVLEGVKVYDPRLDSTYPGGSGSCVAFDEDTYVYSENPWLHALTWFMGRYQAGKKVMGVGMALAAINTAAYVEAANVADANGWTCGGVVFSTDDKWDRGKAMAQAGGGVPTRQSAQISCIVNAPRVSLATITRADLAGDAEVAGTTPRRQRINGIVPRYRSEDHDWEIVPASEVRVSAYVTADGGERTREMDLPLVQDVDQAAQLARYEIENNRERGPIRLPLKPIWLGYKPGDCVTVNIAEIGLVSQTCIIRNRTIDPGSGIVSLELVTETAAKHAAALGVSGTAPPPVDTTPPDVNTVAAPGGGAWTLTATSITAGGYTQPALVITGASDNDNATGVIFEYRVNGDSIWNPAAVEPPTITRKEILGVNPDTDYDVAISYMVGQVRGARLILTAAGTTPAAPYVPSGGLAGYALLTGGNSFSGDQTLAAGSSLILDDSSGSTFQGALTHSSSSPFRITTIRSRGGAGSWQGAIYFDLSYNAGSDFRGATLTAISASAADLDIAGEIRADSLRIDATPASAAAIASTHKLAVNLNGSTYYLMLSNV